MYGTDFYTIPNMTAQLHIKQTENYFNQMEHYYAIMKPVLWLM